MLRGAAGVGAIGFAAAAGAGGVFAAARPQAAGTPPASTSAAVTRDTGPEQASGGPLVVYLRDTAAGEFDVFNGTSHTRVRDPRLVAQLLDGIAAAE
jgi:hypothetical protein